MAKTITLRYAGRCADCGTALPVGTRAKWYGNGRVYGIDCHERPSDLPARRSQSRDYGVYNRVGDQIGSTCGCIDYPCCGH